MKGNNPMEFHDIGCSHGKYNSICEILPADPTSGNFTINQVIIIEFHKISPQDLDILSILKFKFNVQLVKS